MSRIISVCMKKAVRKLICVFILTETAVANAQLEYVTNADGTSVTVTGYAGSVPSALVIPSTLGGLAVTGIGDEAFEDFSKLNSVVIPNSVTNLGNYAFANSGGQRHEHRRFGLRGLRRTDTSLFSGQRSNS